MQIDVADLTEAGRPFAHTYAPTELPLEDEGARLSSEARAEGRASRKGRRVRVRGAVAAEVEVNCDRCAAAVAFPVRSVFDVSYDPPGADGEGENTELQAEDLGTSVYAGESIDLDELAREQILLALPSRTLCRETCAGLCPICGADLNQQACACEQKETDPRWAGLAALKKDVNSKS